MLDLTGSIIHTSDLCSGRFKCILNWLFFILGCISCSVLFAVYSKSTPNRDEGKKTNHKRKPTAQKWLRPVLGRGKLWEVSCSWAGSGDLMHPADLADPVADPWGQCWCFCFLPLKEFASKGPVMKATSFFSAVSLKAEHNFFSFVIQKYFNSVMAFILQAVNWP